MVKQPVTEKPTELSYVPGLNGLRALAILAVLFCHANIYVGNLFPERGHRLADAFAKITGAGWIGVDLFFVISGFLITRILYHTKGQPNYFRNFYMRRTLRIFPLYYFYAALVLIAMPMLGVAFSDAWKHLSRWDLASVFLYFYNFRVAETGHHLPLVNQLWSLAVEEHFYFIWPLIVCFSNRKTIIRVTLAGCALSFLCRLAVLHWSPYIVAAYVLSPCRVDGLLLGSFLAITRTETRTWQQVRAVAPYAFGVSLFVILAIARYQGHFYDFVAPGEFAGVRSSEPVLLIGLSMLAVFFSCVLVFVLDGPIYLTRLLEHPVFTRVGIYSYGIYIYHILVITAGLLIIHAVQRRIDLPAVGQKMVLVFFELVFSTLIAALSFRYFESPILKWKSKFSEKSTASALV